ncbi:MAG: DUF362 domain-containing protein, partial [Calditrichaeota bacterium]
MDTLSRGVHAMKKSPHPCCNHHHKDNTEQNKLSRRKFMTAVGLASAGVIANACSRSANPLEPASSASAIKSPLTPPSGHAGTSGKALSQVASCHVNNYDYATLKANIEAAVDAIGGLSDICKSGDTVGIKLNMTGGSGSADKCPRNYGENAVELYWTHPTILRICMELFKDAGAGRIIVMEAIYDQKSYEGYGYADVVKQVGGEFVNLNKKTPYSSFSDVAVASPLGRWDHYYHNQALHELNCFISLPKAKRHYGA